MFVSFSHSTSGKISCVFCLFSHHLLLKKCLPSLIAVKLLSAPMRSKGYFLDLKLTSQLHFTVSPILSCKKL